MTRGLALDAEPLVRAVAAALEPHVRAIVARSINDFVATEVKPTPAQATRAKQRALEDERRIAEWKRKR